jgi:hypothetical protein
LKRYDDNANVREVAGGNNQFGALSTMNITEQPKQPGPGLERTYKIGNVNNSSVAQGDGASTGNIRIGDIAINVFVGNGRVFDLLIELGRAQKDT